MKRDKIILLITWISRFLCGGLFIFSGFVKGVDPWGTFFKMEEYLAVMGIPLPFALLRLAVFALCSVEFIVGCFLITGCFRKSCPVFAGLIMVLMLPLSLWVAMENPVADCGCFGDAIHISNWLTFGKNIILSLLIIWLLKYNISAGCIIAPAFQWLAVVASGIFIVLIELVGFFYQPLIDFRGFPVGSYLFVTEKNDFEGMDVFDIFTGDDKTNEAISENGKELVVMIPKVSMISPATTWKLNSLYDWAKEHKVKMIGIVSGSPQEINEWEDLSMASYPLFLADDSTIKEVVRGNPGILYLDKGKIVWKTTLNAIDVDDFQAPEVSADASSFGSDNKKFLRTCVILYLAVMLILAGLSPRYV